MKINETVRDILAECRVEENILYLPDRQLDRDVYTAVNKVLNALGGKWNRKVKGHVFDYSPEAAIEEAILSGEYTDKKKIASGQVCIPAFALKPGTECADLIRRLYTDEEASKNVCCTFAFNPDYVVKLRGHFLDDVDATETAVLTALKDADELVREHGEKLVSFMRWIMEK